VLIAGVTAVGLVSAGAAGFWPGQKQVGFNREVRPILNGKCITCHGGVKQAGGFSVLFREDALGKGKSGRPGIVPGDPDASEVIRRVTHPDPAERMPRHGKPLTADEISTLRRWIAQGAKWQDHWAYIKPVSPVLPEVSDAKWGRNGIDRFVLARLDSEGLKPSGPASCDVLIRRVSLDLIGLPPTTEEAAAFCRDPSETAYRQVVERLLASPRYGEHWASMWLDLSRYADTRGYERDFHRAIWRYRDWLIDSFNRDLPFDRFTTEQMAGDLIPGATDEQVLATAFHRNTMTNDEGGTSDEEFRTVAVLDRVNTTWEVWQGTTISCVQCHSHPYDPFRHKDYYGLVAFFNNTADADWNNENPRLPIYAPADQARLRSLLVRLDSLGARPDRRTLHSIMAHMEATLYPRGRIAAASGESVNNGGENEAVSPKLERGSYVRYANVDLTGMASIAFGFRASDAPGAVEVRIGSTTGPVVARAPIVRAERRGSEQVVRVPLVPTQGRHDLYFNFERHKKQSFSILWYAFYPTTGDAARDAEILALQRQVAEFVPEDETPVLFELPQNQRRVTRVFERGNWLVPADTVSPTPPGSLPPMPAGAQADRLGLARWLTSPENPLTARVTVNRYWAQFFGTGIVETLEDFGTQGAAPSHPELLDWMAVRFMKDHKWSVKSLHREIVTSSTYRQSSNVSKAAVERDPANRLLARGPRVRLSAEQVRDQALAVSGLLSGKMHGRSVMPPQPPGLWKSPYNGARWIPARGEDRYRRALYTYWKRTMPYPSMMTFDSPTRELAVSRRIRTNTPLQALVTLNDPVFVEASQALARYMASADTVLDEQLKIGYRRALATDPSPATLARLRQLYDTSAAGYRQRPALLRNALNPYIPYDTAGVSPDAAYRDKKGQRAPDSLETPAWAMRPVQDSVRVAALTAVAGAILNLDAFLTKQ
jgi:hypothetical protein